MPDSLGLGALTAELYYPGQTQQQSARAAKPPVAGTNPKSAVPRSVGGHARPAVAADFGTGPSNGQVQSCLHNTCPQVGPRSVHGVHSETEVS